MATAKKTRGRYTTHVVKNCPICNTQFSRPPSQAKAMYCGRACADIAQTTSERFDFTCEECGKVFRATKDHGADRRFCSRKCFCAKGADLSEKPCPNCGDIFKPGRSTHTADKANMYCSVKCRGEAMRNGEEKDCLNCGKPFYITPSQSYGCCSIECRREYYRGELAPTWKGGKFVTEATGHKFVAFERPDRVGKYVAEHRMVVMQAIGRLLDKWEYVVHINNVPDDNRPENLYVCGSNSQYSKLRNGSLPWPTKSNLKDYK